MAGTALRPGIHFLTIFLVFEDDGDIICEFEKVGAGEGENTTGQGSEDNAAHPDFLGAARASRFGILAGPHCKEKCTENDVGGVCISGHSFGFWTTSEEFEKLTEQLGGYCFLPLGRWISVVERF
jgi:hypothetical protein